MFLILVYLSTYLTNRKKNLLFLLKYIVLYELLNNPTPILSLQFYKFIIEEKYMKIFDTGGYICFFLELSCNAVENHRFASLISGSDH